MSGAWSAGSNLVGGGRGVDVVWGRLRRPMLDVSCVKERLRRPAQGT
jgi:hypothetical protein